MILGKAKTLAAFQPEIDLTFAVKVPAHRSSPILESFIGALIEGGNLAVRLGPPSDGLRAIDVDRKDRQLHCYYEEV